VVSGHLSMRSRSGYVAMYLSICGVDICECSVWRDWSKFDFEADLVQVELEAVVSGLLRAPGGLVVQWSRKYWLGSLIVGTGSCTSRNRRHIVPSSLISPFIRRCSW